MAAGPEPVKGSVVAEEEPLETVSASSQSEFRLRVHTHRSDSETQVEIHIFGENQVKTQKSLATKVLQTVIRMGCGMGYQTILVVKDLSPTQQGN